MLTLKVALNKAEQTKRHLMKQNALDYDFIPEKKDGFIFFPVSRRIKGELVEKKLSRREKKLSFHESLKLELAGGESDGICRAYDAIGSIAIIEIPDELAKKERLIGKLLLDSNKNIRTVLKRGTHSGVYRTQKLKHLAGARTKETIYTENGVRLKLDVEKVYFSVRLATERRRICGQVKKGENILVMFSGCAPYVCVIAKHTAAAEVVGIEINPAAHDYAVENVRMNKLNNVTLINEDVKKAVPLLKLKFDRILMPLPKSAEDFLDEALMAAKKGTIVHFYDFLEETDIPGKAIEKITNACRRNKVAFKIIGHVKCGQHAPHVFRVCVDFLVG